MNVNQIIIRADATATIGTGHLMRCLALAQAAKLRGAEVTFITLCDSDALRQRIFNEGFHVIALENAYPDPADWMITSKVLLSQPDAWVVLDGYRFDNNYQKQIRDFGNRLLIIDDYSHLPVYNTDILLNQNLGAEKLPYKSGQNTIYLLGTNYVLLRSEVLSRKNRITDQSQRRKNILVTMGGADPDNITQKVIRALVQLGLKDFKINIVAGPANPNIESIENEIEKAAGAEIPTANGIHLYKNANMAELMAETDLAITAGGSTCWELCFFGIPFIVIVAAENQRGGASELEHAEAAVSLGWHKDVTIARIASAVEELLRDTDKLRSLSFRGRRIVDGSGCERVLTLMDWIDTNAKEKDIQMRRASEKDTLQLWKLANEIEVRRNSFNPGTIPYDKHVKWFKEKLGSSYSAIYVLEVSGILLAQIRYDRKDDTAEIDYAVIPAFRGKGFGRIIMRLTWENACRQLGVTRVRAIVQAHNKASISSFLKEGFEKISCIKISGFACILFEKNLR